MKMRIAATAILAMLCLSARAADDRAWITEDDKWNLFTSVDLKATELGDDTGYLAGLEVGGILNDNLALGIAGYGLIEETELRRNFTADTTDLWWAGAVVEYTFIPAALLHPSVSLFAGAGQIREESSRNSDASFRLLEPAVNLLFNITPASELGIGVGYRFTDFDEDDFALDEGDLDGWVGTLFLRLTEF